jgi:hypothetical protein
VRLALAFVVPVIGFEQFVHSSPAALFALPLYVVLHWVSDALLALPLGVAAVWAGHSLAARWRLGMSSVTDLLARAGIIAVLLALLLVPGQALHDEADRLTHSHAVLAIHDHTALTTGVSDGPLALASDAVHALSDGLQAQAVGLPLAFLALLGAARGQRRHLTTRNEVMSGRKVGL